MAWAKRRAKKRFIHLRGFPCRLESRSIVIWEQHREQQSHLLGSGIGLFMLLDPETGNPIGAARGLK